MHLIKSLKGAASSSTIYQNLVLTASYGHIRGVMVQVIACNGKIAKIDFLEYGKKELHKRPNKGMYTSDALKFNC